MKKMLLLAGIMVFALASIAYADPGNVTDAEASTKLIGSKAAESADTIGAFAGNVTRLNITDTRETNWWQGLYGNATVAIELTDGSTTFFNWESSNPSGEIYFARAAVTWSNVAAPLAANIRSEQVTYDMADDNSTENLTATYGFNAHPAFDVGTTTIGANSAGCVSINDFDSVILWDSGNSQGVYAAIINNSATGYDGSAMDFQTILPTDGTAQTYLVYAELA